MTDTGNGAAASPRPQAGATVLVVEDDPRLRRVTLSRLESLGYRALEADAAASAIELLGKHPEVDLIFADLLLPGELSGIELAKRVRARYPGMCIVLTSGYAAEMLHSVEENLGLQVLRKPYNKATLARVIHEALCKG